MKLFIIYEKCDQIIGRKCGKFNEIYPAFQPMNEKSLNYKLLNIIIYNLQNYFVTLQNNSLNYGSKLNAQVNNLKHITGEEHSTKILFSYFNAYPQASI